MKVRLVIDKDTGEQSIEAEDIEGEWNTLEGVVATSLHGAPQGENKVWLTVSFDGGTFDVSTKETA